MIPQATEQFWNKLSKLSFISPELISQWQQFSEADGASWSKLCARIESESVLSATHLNQLSSPNGQRIHFGNYLLLRPSYHPLGWETYQVVHAKLRQPFRLIFLPSTEIELPIQDIQNSRPTTKIDLLQRAKTIASISSNAIVKVIDIEQFDDKTVIVTQFPDGQLLTSLLGRTDVSPQQWACCIESLANELHLIHRSNVSYGGVDPVMIQVTPESFRCRLDFLISSPSVGLVDSVPLVLTPEEQSLMIDYRSAKTDWMNTSQKTLKFSHGNDWQTLGAFLAYIRQKHASSPAHQTLCQNLTKTIEAINSCSEFSPNVTQTWVDELRSDRLLHAADSPANSVDNLPILISKDESKEVADPLAANINSATGLNPESTNGAVPEATGPQTTTAALGITPSSNAKNKKTPKSTAQRRTDANQTNQRQKLTMLVAVLAPLPIVLIGLGIYSMSSNDSVRLPDKTTSQSGGELPDSPLPDSKLPDSTLAISNPAVNSQNSNSNRPAGQGNTQKTVPGLPNIASTPSEKKQLKKADIESSLPDNSKLASNSLTSPNLPAMPQPDVDDLGKGQSTEIDLDSQEPTVDQTVIAESTPESSVPLDTAQTENPEGTVPETKQAKASAEFITFENIPDAINLRSKLAEALERVATDKSDASMITIDLGPMNTVTGKGTKATWDSPSKDLQLSKAQTSNNGSHQTWELTTKDTQRKPVSLGKLEATTAGKLMLTLPLESQSSFAQFEQSKLILTYGENELKHELSFASTSTADQIPIRTAPKLEFDPSRGSAKAVVWDTPELAESQAELTLSLSGKPLNKIPSDSPDLAPLNLRKNEYMYYLGEEPKQGSIMLWVKFLPGRKTRLQAQLNILTPNQLWPMKLGTALDLSEAANREIANSKIRYDQLKSVRAKPGEGAKKDAELKLIEQLQTEANAFIKSLEFAILNGDGIVEGGLDFKLSAINDGLASLILQSGSKQEETVEERPEK